MLNYHPQIEVPKNKLEDIFKKMHEAELTITDCYYELGKLGVLKFVEEENKK